MTGIIVASYATAAVAFVGLAALLALHLRSHPAMRGLFAASLATAVWAVLTVLWARAEPPPGRWLPALDAAHAAIWLALLAALLPGRGWRSLRGLLLVAAVVVPALLVGESVLGRRLLPGTSGLVVLLAGSLLALVAVEQLLRNASREERRAVAPLCLGLGALFVYELFVYSHALLLGQLDPGLWAARGFVNAAVVPLLAVATQRHPRWASQFYVSRQMVFYTTTLFGAGLYLVAMALGGYVIRLLGGEWGLVLQVAFLAAALLLLSAILFSGQLRARLRVFINKHFFRSRYDYREEWLRLIRTLANRDGGPTAQRALRALADILESPSGELWLSPAVGEPYLPVATLAERNVSPWPPDHPVIQFLAETNWIIDTHEYARDPERYAHAFRELPADGLPGESVIVPLRFEGRLLGLTRLDRNAARGVLNYEDHDLLKTVGRQVAVFLAQERAREALAETRQFEAFNRTTAFLMHDLKNLMAQQALIVQNAPRHRDKPGFIDDALGTIERSVVRMKKLLDQLSQGPAAADTVATRVNLTPILEEVVAAAADRAPVPSLEIERYCEVRGDRDRLSMAVSHAVRNAQEATPAHGEVRVRLYPRGEAVVVEIADTGSGMDETFIRERLFRPFDTTKGASGMGIGAYQVREYLRGLGGHVEVDSVPGEGTCLRLVIPGHGG
ncbi:MAG: PEP-CTERM system histidine kinase PrsK [Gammaproteobacteria bacterium]|nr:PEP-CTERM system histidine kinase PrsK [Gammaproteobacteria bacterium]